MLNPEINERLMETFQPTDCRDNLGYMMLKEIKDVLLDVTMAIAFTDASYLNKNTLQCLCDVELWFESVLEENK